MQTLATRECQPHALGMQALLDWAASPDQPKPTCPYEHGTIQWDDWHECFYREQADLLAVVHNL